MNLCANHREKLSAILTDLGYFVKYEFPRLVPLTRWTHRCHTPSYTVTHRRNAIRAYPLDAARPMRR